MLVTTEKNDQISFLYTTAFPAFHGNVYLWLLCYRKNITMGQTGNTMATPEIIIPQIVLRGKRQVFLTDGDQLEKKSNNTS